MEFSKCNKLFDFGVIVSNINVTYHYRKNFTDYKMDGMHTHGKNNFEIMYIHKGVCNIKMPEETVTLSAGSYIILNGIKAHAIEASASILNLEFCIGEDGTSFLDVQKNFIDILSFLPEEYTVFIDAGEVYGALQSLLEELERYGDGFCSNLLLKRLFVELYRNKTRYAIGGAGYVKIATEYIKAHFCEKLSITEIAQVTNINHSYLQVLFKKHTGKTVTEYINTLRIEKACFIMRNTKLPVIDIAIDCGFYSRQHFMYVFKRITGKTAREYRRG